MGLIVVLCFGLCVNVCAALSCLLASGCCVVKLRLVGCFLLLTLMWTVDYSICCLRWCVGLLAVVVYVLIL